MAKRRRAGHGDQRAARGTPATSARPPTRPNARTAGRRGSSTSPIELADVAALGGSRQRVAVAAIGTGLVAFLLYARTLAPSVVGGDSGELISAAWVLGVAHPPGYPTFTILAHVFGLLPLGSPAVGMNLFSAVLDGVAVGLAVVAVLVLVSRLVPSTLTTAEVVVILGGAVGGAGLLAVSSTFWAYSLVTEVFPLNNLLAVGIVVLMIAWQARPSKTRLLWLAALLSGLALTNQQTIVLFGPGLLILYGAGVFRARTEDGGTVSGARQIVRLAAVPVLLVLVGLLPYLYLPLAAGSDPVVNWGDPRTLGRLWAVVSRQSYGTLSLTVRDTSGGIVDQLLLLGGAVVAAVTPFGIALAALGWWAVTRASIAVGLALATLVIVSGPLFVAFANPPLDDRVTRGVLERFYLLPTIVVAILAGIGLIVAGRRGVAMVTPERGRLVAIAFAVAVVASLAILAVTRLPSVDQSDNRVAETYGRDILEPLPPDALLLTRSDENYTSVLFAQVVAGRRPDVVAVDVELLKLSSSVDQLRRQHPDVEIPFGAYDDGATTSLGDLVTANLGHRPIFVVGKLKEDLSTRFDLVPWGLTRRFLAKGSGPPPDQAARDDAARFAALHPPTRAWPETTWEGAIAADYGGAAFEDAHARHLPGQLPDASEIADLYRTALRLAPQLASADKNLGLLLLDNGGSSDEIVAVWRRYLELEPDDPDAAAIRSELARLTGSP